MIRPKQKKITRGCTKQPLFGLKLKHILKEKNISIKNLASMLHEDPIYIHQIIDGKKCIQFITLIRICEALDISVNEFADCILQERMQEQDFTNFEN